MAADLLTVAEFDALEEEWNGLLNESAANHVFLRWEWIHTWWRFFANPYRLLFIFAVRENGRLIGIAPFYIDRGGFLGFRRGKFCSDELSPDYMDVIARRGREADVLQNVRDGLAAHAGRWDLLSLDLLRKESLLLSQLTLLSRYRQTIQSSHQCPCIHMEGSFDAYIQAQHSLERFSLPKKQRKLFDEQQVTHRYATDEESRYKGLEHLFLLHGKRSAELRHQTSFIAPRVKEFHHEVSRLFLKAKILNLQLLYAQETPISAHYGFNYNRRVYFFQSGFDPAWSKWSVSMVQTRLHLQRAFAEGYTVFDFLKGNESYKSLWANAGASEVRLTLYNRTLRGALLYAAAQLKTVLRRLKHGVSGLPWRRALILTGCRQPPPATLQN